MRWALILFAMLIALSSSPCHSQTPLPIDTSINYVYSSPDFKNGTSDSIFAELTVRLVKNRFRIQKDFFLIFRLRDPKYLPFMHSVYYFHKENPVVAVQYFGALSQMEGEIPRQYFEECSQDDNSIVREMCAMVYANKGVLGDSLLLQQWSQREKSEWVRSSLEYAMGSLRGRTHKTIISYLPVLSDNGMGLGVFYNKQIQSLFDTTFLQIDSSAVELQPTKAFVAPIQQFGHNIKNAPTDGRFGRKNGPVYHVGVDAGWLLAGLPVHSMSDGVVRLIQHESTWGVFIAIESKDRGGAPLVLYYGHLGENIPVQIGQRVKAGELIGRIGESVSYANGGYWAHVHVGIARGAFGEAIITGYARDLKGYLSPYDLVP